MNPLVHSVAEGGPASAIPAASAVSGLSPQARQALTHLADVAVPPPVSWQPHTAGWAILAALLLLLLIWLAWIAIRHWRANRYRRAALAEVARLEASLTDAHQRGAALVALAALLKRCTLAAWPRERTAALSGPAWTAFLAAQSRTALHPALTKLLDDLEYRTPSTTQAISEGEARAAVQAARQWISHHRVVHGAAHVPA